MAVKKVRRRGKLVWRARVMLDGKTAVRYCSRKDEAVEAEVELRERLEREAPSEASGLPHWEGKVPTVEEFVPMWLRHQETENRPAEMRTKRQILRDHLQPTFGGLQLDQLTTQLVDAYKARKLQDLAPNTVANHVTTLKRMLSTARDWDVISKVPKLKQVKRPVTEFDFLDFEEAERYLDAADDRWRTFLFAAMRTGLRLGELRGLQWGDVDLERRRIRVARAFTKDGWGIPKSGKGRTVDLAHDVVGALASHKPARAGRKALVFPSETGVLSMRRPSTRHASPRVKRRSLAGPSGLTSSGTRSRVTMRRGTPRFLSSRPGWAMPTSVRRCGTPTWPRVRPQLSPTRWRQTGATVGGEQRSAG